MRLGIVATIIALPLLAACSNEQAPPPAAETPAVTAPAVKAPAVPAAASLPAGAQPLIGKWAASLGSCGDAAAVTTITATSYASPAGKCDMNLTASGDGFAISCGNTQLTLVPVFAPSGEGINVIAADGKRQTILRCTR